MPDRSEDLRREAARCREAAERHCRQSVRQVQYREEAGVAIFSWQASNPVSQASTADGCWTYARIARRCC